MLSCGLCDHDRVKDQYKRLTRPSKMRDGNPKKQIKKNLIYREDVDTFVLFQRVPESFSCIVVSGQYCNFI